MKRFDIEKARNLGTAIQRAQTAQIDYLAIHFPTGHSCDVLLNGRQKHPSPAKIWGVGSNRYSGEVAIELLNQKQYSRYRIRRLSPEQVLNVRPAEGVAS